MSQFLLHQGKCKELQLFTHIVEFANQKIQNVQLNTLEITQIQEFRILYVTDGKYEWMLNDQFFTIYPGDMVIICPGQKFGSDKGFFDAGTLTWISIKPEKFDSSGDMALGKWSSLSETENKVIGKIFASNNKPILSRFKTAGEIFLNLEKELFIQEIGFRIRVNHLIDELLISIARQLSKQDNWRRDFPQTFMKLEQTLRDNLSHQWTVEEMAVFVGLGTTAFTAKVKSYTGFSPLNYLINIRISEAIKLLKRTDLSLTDIALDTGFYSSQHFSTTFKKLTGYTPTHFKKSNIKKI